jgi:hypothetical protein
VALVTRLSGNQPAGCMAEEIIAVAPLDEARALLELESTTAGLRPMRHAKRHKS